MLPGMVPTIALSSPAVVTYVSSNSNGSDLSTYNFTSQAIGASVPSRVTIVGVAMRAAGTSTFINSVSVGGIAATKIAPGAVNLAGSPTGNTSRVEWWAARTGSLGTTATISVALSSTAARCGIAVYRKIYGRWALDSVNAYQNYTPSAPQVTISAPALSYGIAMAMSSEQTSPSTNTTWTGLTENYDMTVETRSISGALAAFDTGQSNRLVRAQFSQTSPYSALECIVVQ